MSDLIVLITGLCEFVPDRPIIPDSSDPNQSSGHRMHVLMAENARPTRGAAGHAHEAHELHVPVLIYPEADVVKKEGFRLPDAKFVATPYSKDQQEQEMAVFYLDDQEMAIPSANSSDLTVNCKPVEIPCPRTNKDSFLWVANLQQVNQGSETVKDGCVKKECHPSVAARLLLTEGTIGTGRLTTTLDGTVVPWKFKEVGSREPDGDQPKPRAIAALVRLECSPNLIDGRVELTTSLLLDESAKQRESSNWRVRAIFERAGGQPLKIGLLRHGSNLVWIKHMPLLDILHIRLPRERDSDPHFAHLYKMSDREVPLKVPHTAGLCLTSDRDLRHQGSVDCPPGLGTRIQTGQ